MLLAAEIFDVYLQHILIHARSTTKLYCLRDPELVDQLCDLLSIHVQGHDVIVLTLFQHSNMRTQNTVSAVVDNWPKWQKLNVFT